MSKIRKKAPVKPVQPVRSPAPPYDPMTPPVKKKKSADQGYTSMIDDVMKMNGTMQ